MRQRAQKPDRMPWAVELVEVHRRPLLRGVSFGAPAGAITAVTGGAEHTGALIFRMVLGLEAPEAGAVLVRGADISRAGESERIRITRGLGAVFAGEDFGLFGTDTVRENVATAVRHVGRTGRRREGQAVAAALDRLDLAAVAGEQPSVLPLAARRRLAFARALAQRAPLVVVDAFDAGTSDDEAMQLASLLREDRDERGASAVLIVADAGLAARVADHVVDLGARDAARGLTP
jgi:ABC-type transporter Mla maintaining outer membrane lipid asymmetry ATPase subunit MlaF